MTGTRLPLRARPGALLLLALLAVVSPAWGQAPGGPGHLSPEERAMIERHRQQWERLTPEERQRVLEHYRQWRELSP